MVWLNAINRTLRVSLPAVYLRRADEAYSGDLWLSLRQTACLLALNRAGATEYGWNVAPVWSGTRRPR
jgi:hypothetical protein